MALADGISTGWAVRGIGFSFLLAPKPYFEILLSCASQATTIVEPRGEQCATLKE